MKPIILIGGAYCLVGAVFAFKAVAPLKNTGYWDSKGNPIRNADGSPLSRPVTSAEKLRLFTAVVALWPVFYVAKP